MTPPQTRWFVAFHILAVWLLYLAGTHFGARPEGALFPVDSPVVMFDRPGPLARQELAPGGQALIFFIL